MVAESLQPGVNVSDLARLHGINRGLLQTWRRAALREPSAGGEAFVPVRIEEKSTLSAGLPDDGRAASVTTGLAAAPAVGTRGPQLFPVPVIRLADQRGRARHRAVQRV